MIFNHKFSFRKLPLNLCKIKKQGVFKPPATTLRRNVGRHLTMVGLLRSHSDSKINFNY